MAPQPATPAISFRAVYRQGLTTNVLNPKVAVFYLALLHQFVSLPLRHVGLQIFLLGCIHNVIGVVFLISVGLVAGRTATWLGRTGFRRWMDAISGTVLIGLALKLFWSERPN